MLGDFVIDGNANTVTGLFIRNMHHSRVEARVRDATTDGAKVLGCVLTSLKLVCSTASTYGGMSTTPLHGLSVFWHQS